MLLQVARGLFIINEMVDGGMVATDGARRTLLHVDGAELHGLGIECQQTVRQQLANTREVLQCLGSLNGAQHAGYCTENTSLRTRRNGSYWRWLLEEATVAGCARQMGKGLAVEA